MSMFVDFEATDWLLIDWPNGERTYVNTGYQGLAGYLARVHHPPGTGFHILCPLVVGTPTP